MSCTKEQYINTALSYLGTKVGTPAHKELVKIYNSQKPLPVGYILKETDAWCAGFLTAIAVKCNATDIFPCECSAQRMAAKCITVPHPEVGNIVFYDWNSNKWADHVGIITKVNDASFQVLEGNYNNEVKIRTVRKDYKFIQCYGKVNWDDSVKPDKTITKYKTNEQIALEVIQGKWGNGSYRRYLITKAGYDYETIRSLVNHMLQP